MTSRTAHPRDNLPTSQTGRKVGGKCPPRNSHRGVLLYCDPTPTPRPSKGGPKATHFPTRGLFTRTAGRRLRGRTSPDPFSPSLGPKKGRGRNRLDKGGWRELV